MLDETGRQTRYFIQHFTSTCYLRIQEFHLSLSYFGCVISAKWENDTRVCWEYVWENLMDERVHFIMVTVSETNGAICQGPS